MRLPEISRTIQVPEDVTVNLQGKVVSVKGKQGSLTRDFSFASISIDGEGKNVRISAKWPRKKESALVGTIYSHIQNMITGVTKGYSYKLKDCVLSLSNISKDSRQKCPDRKLYRRKKSKEH